MKKIRKEVREKVFYMYGKKCMCCGKTEEQGVTMTVDHIFPKTTFKKYAYDRRNFQVLCSRCNHIKSREFVKDYRYETRNFDRFSEKTKEYLLRIKPVVDEWFSTLTKVIGPKSRRNLHKSNMRENKKNKKKKSKHPDAGQIVKPKWLKE